MVYETQVCATGHRCVPGEPCPLPCYDFTLGGRWKLQLSLCKKIAHLVSREVSGKVKNCRGGCQSWECVLFPNPRGVSLIFRDIYVGGWLPLEIGLIERREELSQSKQMWKGSVPPKKEVM